MNSTKAFILISILFAVVIIAGCTSVTSSLDDAKTVCINLCEQQLAQGVNLSSGPCLSNNVSQDYVCDVAHNPRIAVDDAAANQCSEFGKSVNRFIEVTPDCKFIREV